MVQRIKELIGEVEKFVSSLDDSQHTSELPDAIVAKMIEAEELPDDSDLDEPFAMVGARLRPRPYLGSGALALQEPEDHYPLA